MEICLEEFFSEKQHIIISSFKLDGAKPGYWTRKDITDGCLKKKEKTYIIGQAIRFSEYQNTQYSISY